MSMTTEEYEFLCDLIREASANVIGPGKEYLVESRLHSVMSDFGYSSFGQLVDQLRARTEPALQRRVVEAMTTNETTFFRDVAPFEALRRHIIPEFLASKPNGTINIWSAACSTGQEPYSLAMLIREDFPDTMAKRAYIVGTDIATHVLERARSGRFSQLEVNRGLPASLLVRYFTKDGVDWVLKDDIRRMVDFREVNLIGTWPWMPKMDVVLLRNVLIYFDVETKKRILDRLRDVMAPGAYLFLGATETMFNLDSQFERVELAKASCFRRKP